MISKNDLNTNTITSSFGASPLECSAGPIKFIPLSKNAETANKNLGDYLNDIYDNSGIRGIYDLLKVKLTEIINYIPKIV